MQQSWNANQKPGPEASIQELASRAASRYIANTVKSVKIPKTAYDFEVSWRALSDDTAQQIQLLNHYCIYLFRVVRRFIVVAFIYLEVCADCCIYLYLYILMIVGLCSSRRDAAFFF
jgi:hypothetical protein